jgi:hypothetical protein
MITLSEYVGYIFQEITRARVIADSESKRIAEAYAQDEIMKHFSVPRFKIPEMELTIPVVIAGAKYTTVVEFSEKGRLFRNYLVTEINNRMSDLHVKKNNLNNNVTNVKNIGSTIRPINILGRTTILRVPPPAMSPKASAPASKGPEAMAPITQEDLTGIEPDILAFYNALKDNIDPQKPQSLIAVKYAEIFNRRLEEQGLINDYKTLFPANDLFIMSHKNVLDHVLANTVISQTKIENLLVNPETNIVKNEGDAISVFVIKAKINEEGLFIQSAMDDKGKETKIVEFE